jgi:hypothetical protein
VVRTKRKMRGGKMSEMSGTNKEEDEGGGW